MNPIANLLRPKMPLAPEIKVLINVGATLDVPTGTYIKGTNGRWILNGGLPVTMGVVGKGNLFKSTFMHYLTLSAMSKVMETCDTSNLTYDTEVNIHHSNLIKFTRMFKIFKDNIIASGIWQITDKTVLMGNEFDTKLKEYTTLKMDNAKKLMVDTMFFDKSGKKPFQMIVPTFVGIDSLSEFETADVQTIQEDVELGDKAALTMHMRQGLSKMRFLMVLPRIASASSTYILTTAHVGKDIAMASGPGAPPPEKKLAAMKVGDKIKGVTDKFFFLLGVCYQMQGTRPLINKTTKAPEFPLDTIDNTTPGNDLHLVAVNILRSKSGPTGIVFNIIVSQQYGVLPTLTEFYNIKEHGRFGLSGNLQNYEVCLRPGVKLSRTSVRRKIDEDPLLRRAIQITSELLQVGEFHRTAWGEYLVDPEVLYKDLDDKGYDWDKILKSKGYHLINDKLKGKETLSVIDLLMMRAGKMDLPDFKKENKK